MHQAFFEDIGGYLRHNHPPRGILYRNGAVSDLADAVVITEESPTFDFFVLDTPIGVFCHEVSVLFFDNHILSTNGNCILPTLRGDHFRIALSEGRVVFSVCSMGSWHQLLSCAMPETRSVSIAAFGSIIGVQGDAGALEPFLTRLSTRTDDLDCAAVWSQPLTGQEIEKVLAMNLTAGQLYYLLQTLTMSPVPSSIDGITLALAVLGFEGLGEYHQNQLKAGLQLVASLPPQTQDELASEIAGRCLTNQIQTGVSAQMFRVLLKAAALAGQDGTMNRALECIAQSQVCTEARSRNDGLLGTSAQEQIIWRYMQAYQLAYTSAEFDVLALMQELHLSDCAVMQVAINALYMEPAAAELVPRLKQVEGQLDQETRQNPSLVLLFRAFLRTGAQLPRFESAWMRLYAALAADAFDPTLTGFLGRNIGSPVVLLYSVMHLDRFQPERVRAILYRAFKDQQHIAGLKALHPLLENAPFIKAHADGFSLSALDYSQPYQDYIQGIRGRRDELEAAYASRRLAQIQHVQFKFGLSQVNTPAPAPPKQEAQTGAQQAVSECDLDSDPCPICYGSMQDYVELACSHRICAECIANIRDLCPACRAPVVGFTYKGQRFEPLAEDEGEEAGEEETTDAALRFF